ncbi:MAG: helix-turn-helix transcriptional regulator [Anaerolineae bacterium]|jgi:transcriptional regulator with XRE-family HTH domain|nr:helix-turn-helix transcriptional regulator [Anaerolineae bacterium]MBT7070055.1 helix-turn-helix transcriptional regulator [Anaerolineae bacterium]MBT7323606.1 helix-turn-helix transcriptional regulator [Anaerolineae bacterium]
MDLYKKNALSVNVGVRLRALREERKISIRGLARKSSLSANALSMIERGKTSPSVSTLYKLADALGLPITTFFGEEVEKNSVVFLKSDERTRVPFPRGTWEGLGGEHFVGHVEPFVLTLESGANSGLHTIVHTGHEFVFCLRGQLEYQVEDKYYLLEPGDSLMFSARLRHRWRNTGGTVTNALFLLSGFAEGERPSHMHLTKGKKSDESKESESGSE